MSFSHINWINKVVTPHPPGAPGADSRRALPAITTPGPSHARHTHHHHRQDDDQAPFPRACGLHLLQHHACVCVVVRPGGLPVEFPRARALRQPRQGAIHPSVSHVCSGLHRRLALFTGSRGCPELPRCPHRRREPAMRRYSVRSLADASSLASSVGSAHPSSEPTPFSSSEPPGLSLHELVMVSSRNPGPE